MGGQGDGERLAGPSYGTRTSCYPTVTEIPALHRRYICVEQGEVLQPDDDGDKWRREAHTLLAGHDLDDRVAPKKLYVGQGGMLQRRAPGYRTIKCKDCPITPEPRAYFGGKQLDLEAPVLNKGNGRSVVGREGLPPGHENP